jgi:DNA polymerase-1
MRAATKLYEVKQFEQIKQIEFNIASSDHVGTALVEFGRIDLPKTNRKGDDGLRVEGSRYSTDDQILAPLAPTNPLIRAVLDFRESSKQESTYIDSIAELASGSIDGMLHPKYTTMLTATTRLSSNSPNIQNFPKRRHHELREQVVAPPDHVFVSFDYGQLEARAYACATKDRALCESIIKNEDIHAYWRDQILEAYPPYIERLAEKTNETEESKILKGGRDIIKSDFVFAVFFGSTARNVAERTGLPLPIAEMMVARFWKRFPEAARWVKAQRQLYSDTGSVQTLCGVIRHGILWGNEVINTPIQGSATGHAVLEAQNALSYLSIEMKDPYLHPRMNIHDDLTFILPDNPDLIEAYVDIIAEELVKVRFPWQIVPWSVDSKIGYNWAELTEFGSFIGDYVR